MRERSTIGLKLLDSSIDFPGLCRGITRPTLQMLGIFALFTERFMVSVRYLSAVGHRWSKWIGAILSGPSALLFFVSLIVSFTVLQLNIMPSISSFHIVISISFLFFIFLGVWSVLLVKLIGAIPWIMVGSSFLSVKVYGTV